ncbi:MAG: hypothetical protein ACRD15_18650 [Vicinamibacterales bacterium]
MTRSIPRRTWFGLLVMVVSEAATLAGIEPFHSWNTPIAWTGYILFVDGIVWTRRGNSWLSNSRAEFLFLALSSIPLWLVFELYNELVLRNWHYVGLPASLPLRNLGYAWSFATIWPAIFETGELVSSLRDRRAPAGRGAGLVRQRLSALAWVSVGAGALMLLLPLAYPSPYLAAPIFLGFALLLDPLNARAGSESILGDVREGRFGRLINLMLAGAICGLLWEFWNYWAGAKWIYTVPILPGLRIFEMPVLGYLGFPPFAVECFTMYVATRRWIWRGPSRAISV